MSKIDLIIDALSVAQNSVWSTLNQEALAYAIELKLELAKPEPVVSFTDNEEGLCIQLECNGSYYWQNLSDCDAAEFFVNAYRNKK
jgi:hypothetical protein